MQETWVRPLGRKDPLEKGMAIHSSILPGESHGKRSLVGHSPWGRTELDMTEEIQHAFRELWKISKLKLIKGGVWAVKFLESSYRHPNVQAELRTSGLRERNHVVGKECACVLSCFSRVRLCDYGPQPTRLPVHGISQARILEWVAMASSRRSP